MRRSSVMVSIVRVGRLQFLCQPLLPLAPAEGLGHRYGIACGEGEFHGGVEALFGRRTRLPVRSLGQVEDEDLGVSSLGKLERLTVGREAVAGGKLLAIHRDRAARHVDIAEPAGPGIEPGAAAAVEAADVEVGVLAQAQRPFAPVGRADEPQASPARRRGYARAFADGLGAGAGRHDPGLEVARVARCFRRARAVALAYGDPQAG